MTDADLKTLAWGATLGIPTPGAEGVLKEILEDVESGRSVWTTFPVPPGLHAFQGQSEKFMLMVVCANVVDQGIVHRATAISCIPRRFNVINLPPAVANYLYHTAAAKLNEHHFSC